MPELDLITQLLDQWYPGSFSCEAHQRGVIQGLRVRCVSREGYAFVYPPDERGFLFCLYEQDADESSENGYAANADEVVQRMQPWAFPAPWSAPPPIDRDAEAKRLRKMARGLPGRDEVAVTTPAFNPEFEKLLSSTGRIQLGQQLESLSVDRIRRYFPADAAGRLALKTSVLLAVCDTVEAPARDRAVCLAATGPERRKDPASIQVELVDHIVANQSHRWEDQPWWWTNAEMPASEWLGTAGSDAQGNEQALASLALLDQGRIEEAMAGYGVGFSEDVHRLLGGERISPPACCAHPDAAWTELLINTLRQAAPWKLPGAVTAEAERLTAWAAEKKSRRLRAPRLKFFIFPGQHHSRKACLMLSSELDGSLPRFVLEDTASNARLHDSAWKRSLDVEFARYGIETEPA